MTDEYRAPASQLDSNSSMRESARHSDPGGLLGGLGAEGARRLTLTFRDADLERAFLVEYRSTATEHFRFVTAVTLAITLGFLWQDSIISAQNGPWATAIRIFLIAPLCVGAWLATRYAAIHRWIETVIATFFILVSCLALWIFSLFEGTAFGLSSSVGAGQTVILLFVACTMLALRFWYSVGVGLAVLVAYMSAVGWFTDVDMRQFVAGDFLTAVMAFMISGSVSYVRERAVRRQFLTSAKLAMETQRYRNLHVAMRATMRDTELKTEALVLAKEELRKQAEQENVNKSKFLADAVHDLKQPVQAITNLLEATKHTIANDDIRRTGELIEMAQNATRVMRTSFNAFLELSRLESGLAAAEYSNFDVGGLLDEILPPLAALATEWNVKLKVHSGGRRRLVVRSDRHLLGRVLTNLIANGIKYSDSGKKEGAAVVVGVIGLANRCRIDVVDNGCGIPRRQWNNIFKPFVQLHNPQHDREKGLGLGLSIVNAIVQLLDEHRLDMRSSEGRGTRFSVEVPRTDAEADSSMDDESPGLDTKVNVEGLYVLYVEDDALVRKSTEALFHAQGILVEAVRSVEELTGLLPTLERMPDAVITDYRLPDECTAVDVVRIVAREVREDIPVIVITGEVTNVGDVPGLETARVLRKPIAARTLLRELSSVCQT